jgi:hypothetical protein
MNVAEKAGYIPPRIGLEKYAKFDLRSQYLAQSSAGGWQEYLPSSVALAAGENRANPMVELAWPLNPLPFVRIQGPVAARRLNYALLDTYGTSLLTESGFVL